MRFNGVALDARGAGVLAQLEAQYQTRLPDGDYCNGRELHPLDVQALMRFTAVYPGRYWVDAQSNGGLEGGPPQFNLYALARAAQRGGSHSMSDANGSIWTGGGGFNSSWKSDGGTTNSTCSYDPSDGAGVMCSKTDR